MHDYGPLGRICFHWEIKCNGSHVNLVKHEAKDP